MCSDPVRPSTPCRGPVHQGLDSIDLVRDSSFVLKILLFLKLAIVLNLVGLASQLAIIVYLELATILLTGHNGTANDAPHDFGQWVESCISELVLKQGFSEMNLNIILKSF